MVQDDKELKTKFPVINFIKVKGYDVKLELKVAGRYADVVGVKKGKVVAIEVKEKEDALEEGIMQCLTYGKAASEVYLAIPDNLLNRLEMDCVIRTLPFGIIVVHANKCTIKKRSTHFKPEKKFLLETLRNFNNGGIEFDHDKLSRLNKQSRFIRRLGSALTVENVWMYILSLLERDGKCHAYVLRDKIRKEFHFNPGLVTVYKAAYMLEKGRYITSITSGKRRYYTITEDGKMELEWARRYLEMMAEKVL